MFEQSHFLNKRLMVIKEVLIVFLIVNCGILKKGSNGSNEGNEKGSGTGFYDGTIKVVESKQDKNADEIESHGEGKNRKITYSQDGTEVMIPQGEYVFGSYTGERFRDPSKEIDACKVTVNSFFIDRYPFTGENGKVEIGKSYMEAANICQNRGKRLCSEVEWEIACKGYDNRQYPDGNKSSWGVEGLSEVYEWTDSLWFEPETPEPRGRVVKTGKRCSYRSFRDENRKSGDIGFRCCRGNPNEVKTVLEPLKKPFEEIKEFPIDKFKLLVSSTPEMKKVADDPKMFSEEDKKYVLLRREIDEEKQYAGYIFTTNPVWWRPIRGEELLVLSGYSGKNSFVLALYHLGEGKFKHAASLILLESEASTVKLPIPLILVAGVDRTVINWAPCWNCSEGGSLYIDDRKDSEHSGDFLIHVSYRWGP